MLTNGGVVDVVVGGNHSEVEGGEVHLILNSYALEEGKEVRKRERRGWREGEGVGDRRRKRERIRKVRALCQ